MSVSCLVVSKLEETLRCANLNSDLQNSVLEDISYSVFISPFSSVKGLNISKKVYGNSYTSA